MKTSLPQISPITNLPCSDTLCAFRSWYWAKAKFQFCPRGTTLGAPVALGRWCSGIFAGCFTSFFAWASLLNWTMGKISFVQSDFGVQFQVDIVRLPNHLGHNVRPEGIIMISSIISNEKIPTCMAWGWWWSSMRNQKWILWLLQRQNIRLLLIEFLHNI